MADALFELVMNRNPMIKTRDHGILSVNITSDGKIMIRWGEKAITIAPEKAEKFFAGCVMLCEIARRLGDDVDWSKYWDAKLGKAKTSKTKAKAKRVRVVEEEEGETEEETEGEEIGDEVEVL
ncbi:MAG: hypothetical protein DRH17_13275 [Deltaproteobacteria bacterium]|nr:MAG: hypothetical protein DRH17_13275 [Deltaproteobacteria bacterium]